MTIDSWFLEHCVCPADKTRLTPESEQLRCERGHHYDVLFGVPILLHPDHWPVILQGKRLQDLLHGIEKNQIITKPGAIDSHVQGAIAATNGIMYEGLIGQLKGYPIPRLDLPSGHQKTFLDIGCNWGRWSIAANRLGYQVVGMDPNPEAIFSAYRVSQQLGVYNRYIVADARFLPFKEGTFSTVFSYSVLQHFEKSDVLEVLKEVRRVLIPGGHCKIQMANGLGLRSLYHQLRRRLRKPKDFDVRYWTLNELYKAFVKNIGRAQVSVDGFFSLNPQPTEIMHLPARYKIVVHVSEFLRKISGRFRFLSFFADSLYILAEK